MRLLSFTFGGQSSFGIGVDDGVRDLGARTDSQDLGSCLGALDQFRAFGDAPADPAWEAISFDIPIPNQRRMLCAGLNYHKKYPLGGEVKLPKQPVYFNKPPGSLVAHNEALVRPIASDQLDYEVELAVVIGRSGRHISESDALEHVAGYTILNDGSVRDWQRHGVAAGKNFIGRGHVDLGSSPAIYSQIPRPCQLPLA